jgi:CBS domain-containing protein
VENYIVKDLMVPLMEYATVSEGATLYDAVMALEKAQEEFDHNKYQHRAVLILDKKNHVIGKISQLDVLRAIEPRNEQTNEIDDIARFGFSERFIHTMQEQHRLKGSFMKNSLESAKKIKVIDCMQSPSEGEYVDEKTSLDTAIHQLVMGTHLSLLVTRGNDIVGILRLSDVFAAVFHAMKQTEKKE